VGETKAQPVGVMQPQPVGAQPVTGLLDESAIGAGVASSAGFAEPAVGQ
jgi:hypothetical protein